MVAESMNNTPLADIAAALLEHDDYVIIGHVSPDGDCMGSQLTMMHALRAMGKKATPVFATDISSVPHGLMFLPGFDAFVPASEIASSSCVIVVDVSAPNRLSAETLRLFESASFSAVIDHHEHSALDATMKYVDSSSPSASMIMWEFVKCLGCEITPEIATCAYTGLMTDTGNFQYQNTNSLAFRLAAEMVDAGADVSKISNQVNMCVRRAALKLQATMLSHMELLMDGQLAFSWVSLKDFADAEAVKTDADELIDVLRSIEGVRVACVLRETDENVRGSLRSKDATDVAVFARTHEGGGHKAAAGMTLHGSIEEAVASVREELSAYLNDAWSRE